MRFLYIIDFMNKFGDGTNPLDVRSLLVPQLHREKEIWQEGSSGFGNLSAS